MWNYVFNRCSANVMIKQHFTFKKIGQRVISIPEVALDNAAPVLGLGTQSWLCLCIVTACVVSVFMCLCVCVLMCLCVCVHVFGCVYVWMCVCVCLCEYVCMCVCVCVCMCVWVFECVCTYLGFAAQFVHRLAKFYERNPFFAHTCINFWTMLLLNELS